MTRSTESAPKGFPPRGPVGAAGWEVLDGSAPLPLLTIRESTLAGNISAMAEYCRREGVDLAPHGKTTMAAELIRRQLDAGAWAITVATAWQLAAVRRMGCRRILLANVLVDPAGVAIAAAELASDPDVELYCYVDSTAGLAVLREEMAKHEWPRPLRILLELGQLGGRTGFRSIDDAVSVAEQMAGAPALLLSGVSAFEGLVKALPDEPVLTRVRQFLEQLRALAERLDSAGHFAEAAEIILTAGGSSYFDVVVDVLRGTDLSRPSRVVLRSGGYVTHDIKMYEDTSPLAARRLPDEALRLRPAMELWATVWSRPEPNLVIAGFGKRDVGYDYGLPAPLRTYRRSTGELRQVTDDHTVTELNDQHAFVQVPSTSDLGPGDVMVFGISHPCTTFERWRTIALIDDEDRVIDVIDTQF